MFNAFQIRHKIIAKYIVKNIFLLYLAMFFIISFIVLSNRMIISIAKNYNIGADVNDILPVIFFDSVSFIPILLSFSLFLAIIISLGRLYRNGEMIVINSIGISTKHIMIFIQPIVALAVLLMAIILFYIAPLSEVKKAERKQNYNEINKINFIQEKTFQYFLNNSIALYFKDKKDNKMQDMFLFFNDYDTLIIADSGNIYTDKQKNKFLKLYNGNIYNGFLQNDKKTIVEFNNYRVNIYKNNKNNKPVIDTLESLNIIQLLNKNGEKYTIEIINRFSYIIAMVIFSLLATILAKTTIKSNHQYYQIILGIIAYAIYYNILATIEPLLFDGTINKYLGFFGIHGIMMIFIFISYKFRRRF